MSNTTLEVPAFDLRPGQARDYAFAERLYVETMRPLLTRLDAWDEARILARFRRSFRPEWVSIVSVGGVDAGWVCAAEGRRAIHLHQIHLESGYRSLGIGSRIIRRLLDKAQEKQKSVVLFVVQNNPALSLYERLGFRIVAGRGAKFRMRWDHRPPEPTAEETSGAASSGRRG